MAFIDALDILSEHQEITAEAWSQKAKQVGAPNDWGEGGMQRYVTVLAHGPYTTGAALMINLIGFNLDENFDLTKKFTEADMKDQVLISTTGPIAADKIIEGWRYNLPVHTVGRKFGYVALQYMPNGTCDGVEAASVEADAKAKNAKAKAAADDETNDICPAYPVLEKPDPNENTFTAWLTVGIDSQLDYPYVNQNNITA